jgi:hypothetical protein
MDAAHSPDLSSWLRDRQLMTELIKQHLARAKDRMKKQADKGRSERTFQIGDSVFLKLQPYVQSSLAPRSNQKLSFKYFAPFKVLARIGQVAYKLDLPPSATIHPVFHVSQLKQALPPYTQVVYVFPSDIELPRVPEVILQKRLITRGVTAVPQVLVKWSQWPEDMATWEDLEALKSRFPAAPAWGQAAPQGEGDVSTTTAEIGPRTRKPNPRVAGPEWGSR